MTPGIGVHRIHLRPIYFVAAQLALRSNLQTHNVVKRARCEIHRDSVFWSSSARRAALIRTPTTFEHQRLPLLSRLPPLRCGPVIQESATALLQLRSSEALSGRAHPSMRRTSLTSDFLGGKCDSASYI